MKMLVMLGDTITLVKNDTWVTGQVAGVVLDDHKELERVYLHDLNYAFYMSAGWKIVDDREDEEENEI